MLAGSGKEEGNNGEATRTSFNSEDVFNLHGTFAQLSQANSKPLFFKNSDAAGCPAVVSGTVI